MGDQGVRYNAQANNAWEETELKGTVAANIGSDWLRQETVGVRSEFREPEGTWPAEVRSE